ncbi:hypothetical protein ACFQ3Z_03735 [Streptomyces nogalater]
MTDALYTAGCRRLDLGLESYNQDVLDRMRKDIKASWIAPNLDALLGSGISVHLFGIAGFPGEARWQTARTVEFAAATLARSRERYGVPDSTFGIGPFVLDALSPVAAAPEKYQVRLEHPAQGEDLQMALRYDYVGPFRSRAARRTGTSPPGRTGSSVAPRLGGPPRRGGRLPAGGLPPRRSRGGPAAGALSGTPLGPHGAAPAAWLGRPAAQRRSDRSLRTPRGRSSACPADCWTRCPGAPSTCAGTGPNARCCVPRCTTGAWNPPPP